MALAKRDQVQNGAQNPLRSPAYSPVTRLVLVMTQGQKQRRALQAAVMPFQAASASLGALLVKTHLMRPDKTISLFYSCSRRRLSILRSVSEGLGKRDSRRSNCCLYYHVLL